MITLNIGDINGDKFSVKINSDATVYDLKVKIADNPKYPVECQKLIFAGRVLNDEKSLSCYNVPNLTTIWLVSSKPISVPTEREPFAIVV